VKSAGKFHKPMLLTKQELQHKLTKSLTGMHSHLKMAPEHRISDYLNEQKLVGNAHKSAVMVLFFHDDNVLKMIVIRRSVYVGIHSGQIAFPGGRYEEEDGDVRTTALREIEEEIGITKDKIEIIGRLSDIYVPPSNFLISVFVGYIDKKPIYKIDEREVNEVIEIPFADFFKPEVIKQKDFYVNSIKTASKAPYYDVSNAEIWGASAMVISELLDILKS